MKFEEMPENKKEKFINLYLLSCAKWMQTDNFSAYERYMAKEMEMLIQQKLEQLKE
jgi:hypothetical protein